MEVLLPKFCESVEILSKNWAQVSILVYIIICNKKEVFKDKKVKIIHVLRLQNWTLLNAEVSYIATS